MATTTKKQSKILEELINKSAISIPEESLAEYKNNSKIKKAFFKSISTQPPR